jgi:hypothetical protein
VRIAREPIAVKKAFAIMAMSCAVICYMASFEHVRTSGRYENSWLREELVIGAPLLLAQLTNLLCGPFRYQRACRYRYRLPVITTFFASTLKPRETTPAPRTSPMVGAVQGAN